jgi:type VI secretion system protein ImpC
LCLAPFGLVPEGARLERLEVRAGRLDEAVGAVSPSVFLPVPHDLCPAGALELSFDTIKSFHPDLLVKKNPYLNTLLEVKNYLDDAIARGLPPGDIHARLSQYRGLPFELGAVEPLPATGHAGGLVDDILSMVAAPAAAETKPSSPGRPQAWLAEVETIMAKLFSHIFASPELRTYESSWRGLELLLRETAGKPSLRVSIAAVSLAALETGLDQLRDELISDPPSLLLVDLEWDNSPRAMELLQRLAGLGETLLTPVVTALSPRFFHPEGWDGFQKLSYLPHLLDEAPWAKWRHLRRQGSAHWLTAVVNRLRLRCRYSRELPVRLVTFEEPYYLWTGPVWAVGALAAQRVAASGWPTRLAEHQSVHLSALAPAADKDMVRITEMDFPEERVHQLSEIGVVPVLASARRDAVFLPRAITVAGGSLGYQLALGRMIALALWCRDHAGEAAGPEEVEKELMTAFGQYFSLVGPQPPADLEINVSEQGPGRPMLVSIAFTLPAQVMPEGARIELSLNW